VVLVGRRAGGLDAVRTPDDVGVALAVDHLVRLGHRDVAHVSGGSGSIAAERRAGFAAAVAAAGLGDRARVLEADFSEEGGADAGRRLVDAGLPVTAVVAANDRVALGLLDVMARAGVDVPGRLSVVGYDDSPLARLGHVQLTSVSQEPAAQAREAVRAALERLDGDRREPVDVVVPPRLAVRATTGPSRRSR
jgi:DNA-binding LacI/PurR family transcriptional regulator